ncbi:MAG: iron-sulfur cluster assembly accessory protein [SAR324 cluster bacterium]|nr:iron-sulfur cluster assembly accessory protein [SAR324 cluster bacterium]
MINITEPAILEIKRIIAEKKLADSVMLRISIKGGGCAGFTYVMDFSSKSQQFDNEFESNGLKMVVDRKSLLYVDGTIIDFNTSLSERGFKFTNPKADAACGCGTSFTPKMKPLMG